MKKFKFYFLRALPIIFVLVVIAFFAMLIDMQKKVDEMYVYNETDDVTLNSVYEENDEKLEDNNDVDNTAIKNEIKNEVSNVTIVEKNPTNMTQEQREELVTVDNKQKAVDMVKAKYDTGNGMEFFCDSVLSSGEFVVASKAKGSSSISAYYKVNLETEKISRMF